MRGITKFKIALGAAELLLAFYMAYQLDFNGVQKNALAILLFTFLGTTNLNEAIQHIAEDREIKEETK